MPWYTRWRNVFRPEQLSHELDEEFAHHLAETADRLQSEGLSAAEADCRARILLGNYGIQKENTRDMNIARWLDQTRADFLYAVRQLRLSPGFAAIAVLSLALGIGANGAIFTLINALRLKALPVEHPEQLAAINFAPNSFRSGWVSSRNAEFTYSQWQELQSRSEPFTGLVAFSAAEFDLSHGGRPKPAQGLYVSGDFFRVLGVPAVLGRTFTSEDDAGSCNAAAVISYPFWKRQYAGNPNIIGNRISLDGHFVPIIGVTALDFFGVEVGRRFDVAIPLCADAQLVAEEKTRLTDREAWWLAIIGRRKPDWSMDRVNAWLHTVSPQIMRATVSANYNAGMMKRFLTDKLVCSNSGTGVSRLREQYGTSLWALLVLTALVLLIACANVANLLLARATVRESEIAVRLATGASRGRIVRQLLAESLLLALFGAMCGIGLALAASRALAGFITSSKNPIFIDTNLDWRVLGFTGALASITCLIFGLIPAMRATRVSPASVMRASGRTSTASRERFGLRRTLVSAQVALAVLLLFGALLFVRSFRSLITSDPGFNATGILAVDLDFGRSPIPKDQRQRVYHDLLQQFAAIPGVVSAAETDIEPASGNAWNEHIGIDSQAAQGSSKQTWVNRTSPGYFRTMGTALISGRDFNDHDNLGSTPVAIVNREFAKKFLPQANPIGHTFSIEPGAGEPEPKFQIIGVVANTKYLSLKEDFVPLAYFPTAQMKERANGTNYVLRIAGSPSSVMREAENIVLRLSPSASVELKPLSQQLADSIIREKLMATLSAAFGILAALLASLGLYGVMSYTVASRRREIGIRMAIGAARLEVAGMVLREAVLLLAMGSAAGVVLALAAGKLAASLLYNIKPRDPVSLIVSVLLLSVVALLASLVPARRAAAGDPMHALRAD